jgi:hypothetical protein
MDRANSIPLGFRGGGAPAGFPRCAGHLVSTMGGWRPISY